MDAVQAKTLARFGYSITDISREITPKMTYYKVERGEVVACPNMPADPASIQKYLKRGFTLDFPQVVATTIAGESPLPQGELSEFVCESCGKSFKSNAGLAGHKRFANHKES